MNLRKRRPLPWEELKKNRKLSEWGIEDPLPFEAFKKYNEDKAKLTIINHIEKK